MTAYKQELARPAWLLPPGRLHPRWWIGIGAALIWFDYVMGPGTRFPAVYLIPVILAAWYSGRWPAVGLAVAVPLVRATCLLTVWRQSDDLFTLLTMTAVRGAVIVVMALWFARLSAHERELHRYVQRLEGLLPICSFCKSIRNPAGRWEAIELYIAERSEAQFSHGFCPSCRKTHYPDFEDDAAVPADSQPTIIST
jgi:hypothetical protein